jgi:hypothetical protein
MSPVGFEPTISAGERLQTYALDRATKSIYWYKKLLILQHSAEFIPRQLTSERNIPRLQLHYIHVAWKTLSIMACVNMSCM